MKDFTFASVQPDSRVLILGLGQTGVAAARWCASHGAIVRVADTRKNPPGLSTLHDELTDRVIEVFCGPEVLTDTLLDDVRQLVLSPGLSPVTSPVKEFLDLAVRRGVEVLGEIELFARALADLSLQGYRPAVLAITGTNGKTTVTTMARHLLEAAGLSACAAGNIAPAALDALSDALRERRLPDAWVLELSSFQLHTTQSLKPDAAVVLNVSQDHLDWHGSFQAYIEAKAHIYENAGVAIVSRDDPAVMAMINDLADTHVRGFGIHEPELEGDLGLHEQNGLLWLCASDSPNAIASNEAPGRRRKVSAPVCRQPGHLRQLMPVEALPLRGRHNTLNALAALALVRCLNVGWAPVLHALRDYRGEPDRTEFVRSIAGVDFINDSKGTNVGATVAALEGLGQKAILIAGGLGKSQDFSPLARAVGQHARAVVLIGQDAPQIKAALAGSGVEAHYCDGLTTAVVRAMNLAQPGDAVLLSPACASLDMFADYRERGRVFVRAVNDLALDYGEVA